MVQSRDLGFQGFSCEFDCSFDGFTAGAGGDFFCGFQHGWEELGFKCLLSDDAAWVAGLEKLGWWSFGLGFACVIDDDAKECGWEESIEMQASWSDDFQNEGAF